MFGIKIREFVVWPESPSSSPALMAFRSNLAISVGFQAAIGTSRLLSWLGLVLAVKIEPTAVFWLGFDAIPAAGFA